MVRRLSTRPSHVWGALIAAGCAYEAYGVLGDVEGDTLSEVTRAVFHTSHPGGKAAFTIGWAALTAWFVPHIVAPAWERATDALADAT